MQPSLPNATTNATTAQPRIARNQQQDSRAQNHGHD
jgi:hypothetical protein